MRNTAFFFLISLFLTANKYSRVFISAVEWNSITAISIRRQMQGLHTNSWSKEDLNYALRRFDSSNSHNTGAELSFRSSFINFVENEKLPISDKEICIIEYYASGEVQSFGNCLIAVEGNKAHAYFFAYNGNWRLKNQIYIEMSLFKNLYRYPIEYGKGDNNGEILVSHFAKDHSIDKVVYYLPNSVRYHSIILSKIVNARSK